MPRLTTIVGCLAALLATTGLLDNTVLSQDAPTLAKQNRWVTSAVFINGGNQLRLVK